jgi:hypothetical protein
MTTTVLEPTRESFPAVPTGLTITPVAPLLWRVSRAGGPVLGHIARRGSAGPFAARRLLHGGIHSIELGEFWSPHDAAECFR